MRIRLTCASLPLGVNNTTSVSLRRGAPISNVSVVTSKLAVEHEPRSREDFAPLLGFTATRWRRNCLTTLLPYMSVVPDLITSHTPPGSTATKSEHFLSRQDSDHPRSMHSSRCWR